MATRAKVGKTRDRIDSLPNMIDHRRIAEKLGVAASTVRNWIETGKWPLPHTRSADLYFYKLDDYERWSEGKGWSETMKFGRSEVGQDQIVPFVN